MNRHCPVLVLSVLVCQRTMFRQTVEGDSSEKKTVVCIAGAFAKDTHLQTFLVRRDLRMERQPNGCSTWKVEKSLLSGPTESYNAQFRTNSIASLHVLISSLATCAQQRKAVAWHRVSIAPNREVYQLYRLRRRSGSLSDSSYIFYSLVLFYDSG
jgi:hypothetical protein